MTTDDPANRTDPTKGAYNGFSLNDRLTAARWATRHAAPERKGSPTWCHACGQTAGLIYWHNEDYRTPIGAIPLCAWCHWTLHSRLKPRQAHIFPQYADMLNRGFRPTPCPLGSRWQAWSAAFLTKPWHQWPMGVYHDAPGTHRADRNLFNLVPLESPARPPLDLSVLDGAPILEGQHEDFRVFPPLAELFAA